jgi:Protein of unknown function (DUF2795)
MRDRRDTKEEAKSVWERFGKRWIFGGIAALGIGALTITVFGMRRRAATEDASGESNETVGERFGEDRKEDQGAAALPKEELVRRAQLISRGPTRESQEIERTDTASETEQEASGGSARGESQESEQTDVAPETEQEVRRYLNDVQFPASKDDLVSAARSNDAPEELIKDLVMTLTIREYSDLEDVAVAVGDLRGSGGPLGDATGA